LALLTVSLILPTAPLVTCLRFSAPLSICSFNISFALSPAAVHISFLAPSRFCVHKSIALFARSFAHCAPLSIHWLLDFCISSNVLPALGVEQPTKKKQVTNNR
jgi:hypothetical protein